MKKILFYIITYIWFLQTDIVNAKGYKNDLLPSSGDNTSSVSLLVDGENADAQIDNFLAWIRDSIDLLLPITAIGVFLFVGIRLGIARWNPEEFKKAWMQFIYAIVGIFVVSFAWAAVKLVAGINIF